MANITLKIDPELVKKARKVALERNTTLAELVRGFIAALARSDTTDRKRAAAALRKSFKKHSCSMESERRKWTRDDLHER